MSPIGSQKIVQRNPGNILDATKERLRHGRGNVWKDVKESGGGSYIRTVGAGALASARSYKNIFKEVVNEVPEIFRNRLSSILPYLVMGAGNCMEHATVAMFIVNHKHPGHNVWIMDWGGGDHQFLLMGASRNIEESTVIDTWDPAENGKPYTTSKWYGRNNKIESPSPFAADGRDYLTEAVTLLTRRDEFPKMEDFGLVKGEEHKRNTLVDFDSFKKFEKTATFSAYNF